MGVQCTDGYRLVYDGKMYLVLSTSIQIFIPTDSPLTVKIKLSIYVCVSSMHRWLLTSL